MHVPPRNMILVDATFILNGNLVADDGIDRSNERAAAGEAIRRRFAQAHARSVRLFVVWTRTVEDGKDPTGIDARANRQGGTPPE